MFGETRLLQTFVLEKVLVAFRFWILLVPCISLTLPMFGREMGRCSGVCWLVGCGMVSYWEQSGDNLCHASSVVVLMVMVIFW